MMPGTRSSVLALLGWSLLAAFGMSLAWPGAARSHDPSGSPLRLTRMTPGCGRTSATESWGTYYFDLLNLGDTDRQARALVFYSARRDVQYGRDAWVPARARLETWLLA